MFLIEKRNLIQSRKIKITRQYTTNPEGSVLVEFGKTKVLCTATVSENIPRFLKGKKKGWITAEYSMLPRATNFRNIRESNRGKQYSRNHEIQRFIARSLRASVDLNKLYPFTIILDCDVIQADGGSRTASVTGSCVSLVDSISFLLQKNKIKINPLKFLVASISVGIFENKELCDLNYLEDSGSEFDLNIVMTEKGDIVEIQGTAEGKNSVSQEKLVSLIELARVEIKKIIKIQRNSLSNKKNFF